MFISKNNNGNNNFTNIENIKHQETVIADIYNKTQDNLEIMDEYIKYEYENKHIDDELKDDCRESQKSMREIGRNLEKIDMTI